MIETPTSEGDVAQYVENEGLACYACKSTLYETLNTVGAAVTKNESGSSNIVLFNGTNFDDFKDITRLGTRTIAASR